MHTVNSTVLLTVHVCAFVCTYLCTPAGGVCFTDNTGPAHVESWDWQDIMFQGFFRLGARHWPTCWGNSQIQTSCETSLTVYWYLSAALAHCSNAINGWRAKAMESFRGTCPTGKIWWRKRKRLKDEWSDRSFKGHFTPNFLNSSRLILWRWIWDKWNLFCLCSSKDLKVIN